MKTYTYLYEWNKLSPITYNVENNKFINDSTYPQISSIIYVEGFTCFGIKLKFVQLPFRFGMHGCNSKRIPKVSQMPFMYGCLFDVLKTSCLVLKTSCPVVFLCGIS